MTLYFTCPSTNLLVDNLVSGSDALVLAGKFNPPISESPRPGSGLTPPRPHTPPSLALACPPPLSDTKATPPRLRPIPDPISPSTPSKGGTVQCSGTTKKGRRCMRRVKVACSVLANTHPGVEIERYCYYHAIPKHLQDTKITLPAETEEPRSRADAPGTFETYDTKTPNLEVGESITCMLSSSDKTTPPRRRTQSVSPSSSTPSKGDTVQCSGVTKEEKTCKRRVGVATSALANTPDVERYCFQHTKFILGDTGFYSHKTTDEWVNFKDWIPEYLHKSTQVALRVEMKKPHSRADVPGYIYTFEIRDPETPSKIQLKVGRAVNLAKRIDQWDKQCGSKEKVLRGWWPGTVEDDEGDIFSLMRGRVRGGIKGPHCHRLERLVHLELADLAANFQYLDPNYQTVIAKKKKKGTHAKKRAIKINTPCACGTVHREIFSFDRVESGPYKGKEWDSIVKPVIEKWGAFVSAYV